MRWRSLLYFQSFNRHFMKRLRDVDLYVEAHNHSVITLTITLTKGVLPLLLLAPTGGRAATMAFEGSS